MAIPSGIASTRTLTDIANAIRFKNGENWRYTPGEMADKVAALNADSEGGGMQYPYDNNILAGKMTVLPYTSIANAIRGQNGETKDYKPSEMADAIRALSWETPKAYAVAIPSSSDETKYELRFNKNSKVPAVGDTYDGKTIAYVYKDFEDKIFTSNSQVPWYPQHDLFTYVSFDSTIKPKTCAYMFYMFTSCTAFNFVGLDTSEAVSFAYMFYSCSAVKYINLGFRNTPNLTSMKYMFYRCTSLETIYTNFWDVSKVESFQECFRMCAKLTVINGISGWNVSSACTNVTYMFSSCEGMIRLELGQWDLSGVDSTQHMFSYMSNVQSIDMSGLSFGSKLKNTSYMFTGNKKLTTIYVAPGTDLSGATTSTSMFYLCSMLAGGNGTVFTTTQVTASYARVDGLGGKAGYFSTW